MLQSIRAADPGDELPSQLSYQCTGTSPTLLKCAFGCEDGSTGCWKLTIPARALRYALLRRGLTCHNHGMWLRALVLFGLTSSCGSKEPTYVYAAAAYDLSGNNDACIRVSASPAAPGGVTTSATVSLMGKAPKGEVYIGVRLADPWTGDVGVMAALHRPNCLGQPVLAQYRYASAVGGVVPQIKFALDERLGDDAGTDGGP